MFQCVYPNGNPGTRGAPMTLFDPHSHHLIHQLRQEQLARKAARRRQLGLHAFRGASSGARLAAAISAMARRLAGRQPAGLPANPHRPARPEPR